MIVTTVQFHHQYYNWVLLKPITAKDIQVYLCVYCKYSVCVVCVLCVCVHITYHMLYRCLASGSGDCTVRLWDTNTETPHHVCKGVYSIVCTVYMC